jgi:Spy/CpxP family protein refolding chaperone
LAALNDESQQGDVMKKLILAAAVVAIAATAAFDVGAHPMGPPPGMPHGAPVPSAEMLATSDLTPAQQADVRRILTQKRDALEAAETKLHAQMEALHKQMRDEHERVETQTSDQLRKALGDDAYKRYAEWSLHHGPMFGPDGPGMHIMRMHGSPDGRDAMPPPPPPGAGAGKPDADDE